MIYWTSQQLHVEYIYLLQRECIWIGIYVSIIYNLVIFIKLVKQLFELQGLTSVNTTLDMLSRVEIGIGRG